VISWLCVLRVRAESRCSRVTLTRYGAGCWRSFVKNKKEFTSFWMLACADGCVCAVGVVMYEALTAA
jgi:hypothetical protein